MLNGLGLFAGIGGLEVGLERAGLVSPVCFVEKNDYAQKVLAKRFPEVPIWDDIITFDGKAWKGYIDFISGGFPCQDVSCAGKREGLDGARSGLWSEYRRIISEIRPLFAHIENVTGLYTAGIERIDADLAEIEYSIEWMPLSAKEIGADHLRSRIFGIAYPFSERLEAYRNNRSSKAIQKIRSSNKDYFANARGRFWETASRTYRGIDGVPDRVDRLKCLGNAVVPQCAEYIGRLIMDRIKGRYNKT
jgi:DNA (cytosine-5)-methyltransferase 1